MKNIKYILICLVSVSLFGCKSEQKKSTEVIEIITIEALEKTDVSIQLIDVRTPEEFAEGAIMHAKNIDFNGVDFMERMSELDKNKPVYVYCMVGGRSGRSAAKLEEAGFSKVYDYKGGFKEWKTKGKEITLIE